VSEIPSEQRPPYRRRALMRRGAEAGWWTYESENPPGHTDAAGVTHSGVTYTVRLPDGPRVVLTADEVDGWLTKPDQQILARVAELPGRE
jgi:hypothetical protein